MLSVHKIRASDAAGAARYYEDLGREDYYENGGEPPGEWLGGGADALGLHGLVQAGQLADLFQGYNPLTGEVLTTNAGPDHAPGWDCTFSAPKSVSTIWAVASEEDRKTIMEAHREAVKAAVAYMEQNACFTRHGHGGEERQSVMDSGGLIVAAYEHSTSRNQEPQIHTHALFANMTADGRGIDLDTRWKMAAGAVYRSRMAHRLKEADFRIERDGKSFKVTGVPESLAKQWSSRREEILEAAAEHGVTSAKGMEIAALSSREAKGEINRAELFQTWQAQAAEHGFGPEQVRALKGLEAPELERPDADTILSNLTQQQSTFTRAQLEAEAYTQAQGVMSPEEARTLINDAQARAVHLDGDRFTTREMQEIERGMVDNAQAMHQATTHQVEAGHLEKAVASRTLSDEQQHALQHITAGNQIAAVEGWAGTGKTYMLAAARETWEAQGYKVKGAALAGKAAEGLQTEAGIPSQTLHSLAGEIERAREWGKPSPLDSKTVLVVDEAGMVGSRQMAGLLDEARKAGAKVVLVGDSKQLQPIDAGGAFKAIGDRVGVAEMSDVRRQRDAQDREIARDLREGRAGEALQKLDAKGRLHQAEKAQDVHRKAVANWREDIRQGKDSILLAGTRREVRALNLQARAAMIEDGKVAKEGHRFETAQGMREFAQGDRVIFFKNDRQLDVKNGTIGTVREAHPDGRLTVAVKGKEGERLVHVDTKEQYNHIDHGYAATVHKAQGVTVDRAHVVAGDMSRREWAYVAGSRHREEAHFYATTERLQSERGGVERSGLARSMSRSDQKATTLDHRPDIRTHEERRLDEAGFDRRTHEERQLGKLQEGRDLDAELQAAVDRVPDRGQERAQEHVHEADLGR